MVSYRGTVTFLLPLELRNMFREILPIPPFIHNEDIERPIISEAGIMSVIGTGIQIMKPVERYMSKSFSFDYEQIMSIEYSKILKSEQLQAVIDFFSTPKDKYEDEELLYLLLRSMTVFTWKLDMQFLVHFDKCIAAARSYSRAMASWAINNKEHLQWETNMPYWLRHTQVGFESILEDDIKAIFEQVEFVVTKENGIRAQCMKIGKTYIIAIDVALYFYLQEWNRLLLFGYRLTKYCEKYNIPASNIIKTATEFIFEVGLHVPMHGGILLSNKLFPMPVVKGSDYAILKSIIGHQINFIVGHELGHIVLHVISEKNYSIDLEIEADNYSVSILNNHELVSGAFSSETNKILVLGENDILSRNNTESLLQSIELLFGFFRLIEYQNQLFKISDNDDAYIDIIRRIEQLRNKYSIKSSNEFYEYVEQTISDIENCMEETYSEIDFGN